MKTTVKTATSKDPEGLKTTSTVRGFEVICDEPENAGGTNLGMNPVELLLSSLSSCMTIATYYLAPSQGIELESFRVELEGDMDPDGFMGMNPDVRHGFTQIRIVHHIKCNAPADKAREFVKLVESRRPVSDTLSAGTEVVATDIVVE